MPLQKSVLHFVRLEGTDLRQRHSPFHTWIQERRDLQVFPFARSLQSRVGSSVRVLAEDGTRLEPDFINFASQDYLGLAQDPRISAAGKAAIDTYGVHSAGSPVLMGRHQAYRNLEEKLCSVLQRERCILYPTGWAAGFGVVTGLVRQADTIVMDAFAHNCLQVGARSATTNVTLFPHNNLARLEQALASARNKNPTNGLFVILESLYSMDADSPDLARVQALAREYRAITILDMAHDFGAVGERGLGLLDTVTPDDHPDIIMGSFSKTFASNGGFVATDAVVHDYLMCHSHPYVFSNALSPVQADVVLACADIVFSDEGTRLRRQLMECIMALRTAMNRKGHTLLGSPSPIVPVLIGEEATARVTGRLMQEMGLLANLVEYPAVPYGMARFRFQVMPTHTLHAIEQAADVLTSSLNDAQIMVQNLLHRTEEAAPDRTEVDLA